MSDRLVELADYHQLSWNIYCLEIARRKCSGSCSLHREITPGEIPQIYMPYRALLNGIASSSANTQLSSKCDVEQSVVDRDSRLLYVCKFAKKSLPSSLFSNSRVWWKGRFTTTCSHCSLIATTAFPYFKTYRRWRLFLCFSSSGLLSPMSLVRTASRPTFVNFNWETNSLCSLLYHWFSRRPARSSSDRRSCLYDRWVGKYGRRSDWRQEFVQGNLSEIAKWGNSQRLSCCPCRLWKRQSLP